MEKHFYPEPARDLPALPEEVEQYIGNHDGAGRRVGIVSARFNIRLTGAMVETAATTLVDHGVRARDVVVAWVPGSFEVPLGIQRLCRQARLDAVIACGVVIEGQTLHAELIMRSVTRSLQRLALDLDLPVIDAVVSAPNLELAEARCLSGADSRGAYAALAALESASVP